MKILAILYPGGEIAKNNPGLLGCAENALGLRDFLEKQGHEFVVLTDKEHKLDEHLSTTEILITTHFWHAYITKERISKAPMLRLILTAGVGSDHVDLQAAAERGITVAEITGSNVVGVAEQIVMHILALVRNYMPAYKQVLDGRWDIAEIAAYSHDLEDKVVGIIGAGRIGQRVCQLLKAFDVKILYYNLPRLTTAEEFVFGIRYTPLQQLVEQSDVISITTPLTPETEGLFNHDLLFSMKKGSYLVNCARGKIVDTSALVEALEKGHLAGYAGDVWFPEPAPIDHPWRHMPNHAMVPHYSGTTLEAQSRYADGVKRSLTRYMRGLPIEAEFLIVDNGKVVSPSYSYAFFFRGQDFLRKHVSSKISLVIMFVDLVGSTKMSMTLPADKLVTIIRAFSHEMSSVVESYDGFVLKYVGDAVIAFFPSGFNKYLTCDKAVRCAESMITVVTTGLNPISSKYDYPALKLKIGIDEGENVVVQYGYDRSSQIDILGYTMNVTAKITSITGPNKISVGENVYKLLHPNTQERFELVSNLGDDWKYVAPDMGEIYKVYTSK